MGWVVCIFWVCTFGEAHPECWASWFNSGTEAALFPAHFFDAIDPAMLIRDPS